MLAASLPAPARAATLTPLNDIVVVGDSIPNDLGYRQLGGYLSKKIMQFYTE
jgi:hypothetical protein